MRKRAPSTSLSLSVHLGWSLEGELSLGCVCVDTSVCLCVFYSLNVRVEKCRQRHLFECVWCVNVCGETNNGLDSPLLSPVLPRPPPPARCGGTTSTTATGWRLQQLQPHLPLEQRGRAAVWPVPAWIHGTTMWQVTHTTVLCCRRSRLDDRTVCIVFISKENLVVSSLWCSLADV